MIYGIGIDIVQVARIRAAVGKWGDRFLRRVFTEKEIAYCLGKKDPYPSLSARFAAKEALVKAAGSRFSSPWTDIEISNDPRGKPLIHAWGGLGEMFERNSLRVHISLSHEREYSIACVVLEKDGD